MIYSKKTVKGVFKVIRAVNPIAISMEQEQFLTAMQFWVKSRGRTGCDIFFTHDIAIAEVIKMVNIAEESVITKKESNCLTGSSLP
jgi:hypothetical protein